MLKTFEISVERWSVGANTHDTALFVTFSIRISESVKQQRENRATNGFQHKLIRQQATVEKRRRALRHHVSDRANAQEYFDRARKLFNSKNDAARGTNARTAAHHRRSKQQTPPTTTTIFILLNYYLSYFISKERVTLGKDDRKYDSRVR